MSSYFFAFHFNSSNFVHLILTYSEGGFREATKGGSGGETKIVEVGFERGFREAIEEVERRGSLEEGFDEGGFKEGGGGFEEGGRVLIMICQL